MPAASMNLLKMSDSGIKFYRFSAPPPRKSKKPMRASNSRVWNFTPAKFKVNSMNNFSQQFDLAIRLKFDLMMSQIFIKHGVASEDDKDLVHAVTSEAYDMGLRNAFSQGIATYFQGTPLNDAYLTGHEEYEEYRNNSATYGSRDEFNALSTDERSKEWEDFHTICAQGIAEDLYFYDVMMRQWLVGYVGH